MTSHLPYSFPAAALKHDAARRKILFSRLQILTSSKKFSPTTKRAEDESFEIERKHRLVNMAESFLRLRTRWWRAQRAMGSSSFSGNHHGGSNQQEKEGWKIGKISLMKWLSRIFVTLQWKIIIWDSIRGIIGKWCSNYGEDSSGFCCSRTLRNP